jgi:hypothetical protein
VYAHLKNYELKIQADNDIALQEATKERKSIVFVKLYLFEKEIINPLTKHLKQSKMDLKPITTKCMGLNVLTPQFRSKPVNHNDSNESLFFINQELMTKVFGLYKEYIANFGPNLNTSQVLLYLYKQFFNV